MRSIKEAIREVQVYSMGGIMLSARIRENGKIQLITSFPSETLLKSAVLIAKLLSLKQRGNTFVEVDSEANGKIRKYLFFVPLQTSEYITAIVFEGEKRVIEKANNHASIRGFLVSLSRALRGVPEDVREVGKVVAEKVRRFLK